MASKPYLRAANMHTSIATELQYGSQEKVVQVLHHVTKLIVGEWAGEECGGA